MPHSPEISVVIPVYNGADYICEAIDSVLAQRGPAVEIIVVDNNSIDATSDLVASRYGSSIRLLAESRPGAAHMHAIPVPATPLAPGWPFWTPTISGCQASLNASLRQLASTPHVDIFFTLTEEFSTTQSVRPARNTHRAARPLPTPLCVLHPPSDLRLPLHRGPPSRTPTASSSHGTAGRSNLVTASSSYPKSSSADESTPTTRPASRAAWMVIPRP